MPVLFTGPNCSGCKPVKAAVEKDKIDIQVVDVSTDQGSMTAAQLRIRSLPTIVDNNEYYIGTADCLAYLAGLK